MVDDGPGKKVQPFRSFEPRGGERHVRRNRGVLACVDPLVARGAPARTLPGWLCPDLAPQSAPPPMWRHRPPPSSMSYPRRLLQRGDRPREPKRGEKSRTLVLVATMRSPITGSPDHSRLWAQPAPMAHRPRQATAPKFPRIAQASPRQGPVNSLLRNESDQIASHMTCVRATGKCHPSMRGPLETPVGKTGLVSMRV